MKKYDTYKDSGIEWIGEIPSHWGNVSIKWISQIFAGGTPSKDKEEYWFNGTIPWLNSGTVNQGQINEPSEFITDLGFEKSSAKWIPKGALVIALAGQGKTKGMVAQLGIDATCNQSMAAIVPQRKILARYLLYWLQSNYQNIRNLGGGDLRDGLNLDMIGSIKSPIPYEQEQTAIAHYLDRKTAEIDELIADKKRLLELYEEEKTAIINQAVTKGINPDAPMKDSGIEWLGEIPEHWEVKRLKTIARVQTGRTPKIQNSQVDFFDNGEINWFTPSDFDGNSELIDSKRKIISEAIETGEVELFPEYSIYLVSIGATLGKASFFREKASANQQINIIIFHQTFNPLFGYYFLVGNKDMITLEADYTTLPILNQSKTKGLFFAVPPPEEQQSIVNYIKAECDRVQAKKAKTEKLIELLTEYRTALISEVVTGKIKVIE